MSSQTLSLNPSSAGKNLMAALLATTILTSPMLALSPALAAEPALATQVAGSFADLVAKARPAVVSILVKKSGAVDQSSLNGRNFEDLPDFLKKFFEPFDRPDRPGRQFKEAPPFKHHSRKMRGMGSGFFIKSDGYVVTNNHVVEGADEIKVRMHDGKTLKAKLIGADPKTDLAVVKVEGSGFAHVEFGDSSKLRVGDWVVAVGNPFGLAGTTTAGIVSARGRDIGAGPYDDFIQIDAPINRGNSGGPTFDRSGKVIGVNTAILSPSGGSVGIGFAIPAKVANKVVNSLISTGTVQRGWLGVTIQPITEDLRDSLGAADTTGALVASVTHGSPAHTAGLKSGDVIRAVDDMKIKSTRDLSRLIAEKSPSTTVTLDVWRNGQSVRISAGLSEMPGAKLALVKTEPGRGKTKLGLMLQDSTEGVVIAQVLPDGPAADKGLEKGDVIKSVDQRTVKTAADVQRIIKGSPKDRVLLLVKGKNGNRFVSLKYGKSTG